jgi:hypothetical protein
MALTQVETGMIKDAAVTAAKLASGAARANFGAGAVLQVVSNTSTTAFNTTSSSSYLSTSITPSSATSKILALLQVNASTNPISNGYMYAALLKNGSSIWTSDCGVGGNMYGAFNPCIDFLDSPATTSAVTYSVLIGKGSGGTSSVDHVRTSLILLEIAA